MSNVLTLPTVDSYVDSIRKAAESEGSVRVLLNLGTSKLYYVTCEAGENVFDNTPIDICAVLKHIAGMIDCDLGPVTEYLRRIITEYEEKGYVVSLASGNSIFFYDGVRQHLYLDEGSFNHLERLNEKSHSQTDI